jgi:hypothetical protein
MKPNNYIFFINIDNAKIPLARHINFYVKYYSDFTQQSRIENWHTKQSRIKNSHMKYVPKLTFDKHKKYIQLSNQFITYDDRFSGGYSVEYKLIEEIE